MGNSKVAGSHPHLLVPLLVPELLVSAPPVNWFVSPGKGVGGLNLGNFFVSHRGYTRQGFDQLSTEGSDQERNQEDSSDSEYEEYSALPPQASS